MNINLASRVALVTGGSRGIGRASACALASAGARVAVGYVSDQGAAQSVLNEIRECGSDGLICRADVSRPEDCERLVREVRQQLGGPEVLVVNAGIWRRAPIESMTVQQLNETIDTNLKSAFFLIHEVVPYMKEAGGGNIVLIGSTAGQRGEAFYSHYAASKGALGSLTKSLAAELGPAGIRVNCVAPGWVRTDMTNDVFEDSEYERSVIDGIPLRRIATAEDIAGPVLFLASELARHVQGEILNVNGGSVLCG